MLHKTKVGRDWDWGGHMDRRRPPGTLAACCAIGGCDLASQEMVDAPTPTTINPPTRLPCTTPPPSLPSNRPCPPLWSGWVLVWLGLGLGATTPPPPTHTYTYTHT